MGNMDQSVRGYLAEIGRRGGRRSRRQLSPEAARAMVRLREARRAFARFHAQCFWSSPADYVVQAKDVPWVAERLMTYGGREGWEIGAKLRGIRSEQAGYQLHPVDLATNKLLALVGRDEPRDYLDIHDAMERILPLGALCWAAAGKDPGFTPNGLLDLLRRRGKYRIEDFERLALVQPVDLHALKSRWLQALDDAKAFINSRRPEEMGCLYYDAQKGKFLEPGPEDTVVPHYGRPGGVLPVVG